MEEGCDVFLLAHSHQDLSSTVLHILEPLDALARSSKQKCIAVIQPGGDKGVDKLLGVRNGE